MNITNHNGDNFYYVDSSVMNGTIELSKEEYDEAIDYLYHKREVARYECDSYTRDSLSHLDFKELVGMYPFNAEICLGVRATELICKLFGKEDKHKRQNYGLIIKK